MVNAQTWKWSNPLPTGNTIWSCCFIDANTGIIAGDNGSILKTSDGGQTWISRQSGTSSTLRNINFVDANTGFAVGANGAILKTTDGGDTWIYTQESDYTYIGVDFPDQNTGYIVGSDYFGMSLTARKTMDGGATWNPLTLTSFYQYQAVCFTTPNIGFIGGQDHS